jgi:type IV secretory pathway VirJ component
MARAAGGASRALGFGAVAVGIATLVAPRARAGGTTLSHGRFERVAITRPEGEARGVAILLYGRRERAGVAGAAGQALAARGAFVIAAPVEPLLASLEREDDGCIHPDGDVENLSHFVQAYAKLANYHTPVLVGTASASALAYALLAQAPARTFAGGIGIDFCPHLELRKTLCPSAGLRSTPRKDGRGVDLRPSPTLGDAWTTIVSSSPPPCDAATRGAFGTLAGPPEVPSRQPAAAWLDRLGAAWADVAARGAPRLAPPPAEISDLPTVEVEPHGTGNLAAVLVSGDGGWAGIDQHLGASFAAAGIPVVGIDSLRYFWTARTPESTAADVDRLLRFALARWKKPQALLVGYSQGADVLPFVANRLPQATRDRVALVAMLGLGRKAQFEFHLADWIVTSDRGTPIAPELARMPAGIGLCVYGSGEEHSGCLDADPQRVRVVRLPGNHHFDADYDRLAKTILDAAAAVGRGAVTPSR